MHDAAPTCPFTANAAIKNVISGTAQKTYAMRGAPREWPVVGMLPQIMRSPLQTLADNASRYGDIIPFHVMGQKFIQLNHPDFIRQVQMENHKNYKRSNFYMRFESALGLGLLTSDGEKWRRDRQAIQPMFRREQLEGHYFEILSEVTEQCKQRWLTRSDKGPAEIIVIEDMAAITLESILRMIFDKEDLNDGIIESIHHCFIVLMNYLNHERIFPTVDLESFLHTPRYHKFKKESGRLREICQRLLDRYRNRNRDTHDKYNMLAVLIRAQQENPQHYPDQEIIDQVMTMVFGGFETTSVVTQWLWHVLDTRPDITEKLRAEIVQQAPCTIMKDSSALTYDAVSKMHYLTAVFQETIRLYPPFWVTSREAIGEDFLGDFKVEPKSLLVLPHIILQRDPRFWSEPNAFMPERFLNESGKPDHGIYFPFSNGPRKCIGAKFSELEVKVIFAKLLPLFTVTAVNSIDSETDSVGITYKLKHPMRAIIQQNVQ